MAKVSPERFKELLAKAKATAAAMANANQLEKDMETKNVSEVDISKLGIAEDHPEAKDVIADVLSNDAGKKVLGVARDDIVLNAKQAMFSDRVMDGKDVILVGAAGTGKTTSMRSVTRRLIDDDKLLKLSFGTKWLHAGSPGCVILSFTRKAVNNIRHAVVDELKANTLTIHKLLEFEPIYYEIEDPNKPGHYKTTMRFEPARNRTNPLPKEITRAVFEESSMIGVPLYDQFREAMQHEHQEIFLGDIQQLPPVFGLAILGFKMLELPVVELTEVYRQALNSPIISLAWKILEGNPHVFSSKTEDYQEVINGKRVTRKRNLALDKLSFKNEDGEVKFQIWQKRLSVDHALLSTVKQFTVWAEHGYYNPQEDIILCPFNKAFGTIEINKGIADYLGRKREAEVFEVIAGFDKHYLAVGDRVLYDKEDAFITAINRNGEYLGARFQASSKTLDRWGHDAGEKTQEDHAFKLEEDSSFDLAAIEKMLETAASGNEDRVQAASHSVHIKLTYSDKEDDKEIILMSASDINNLLGGYALTIHKFQGSEAERVFFVMQHNHAVMNQRELLYTAVTRAKKFLHIICEPDTFYKGVKSQKIKGDTLREKAVFFQGKADEKQKEKQLALEVEARQQREAAIRLAKISGKPAVKLEDLVPVDVRSMVEKALFDCWCKAIGVFGEQIGAMPELSYKTRRKDIVGSANYGKWMIKLNPIWLAVEEEAVVNDIIENTIPHEVCHLVDWKVNKEWGHGRGWKVAMIKMGQPPSRLHEKPLPPYLESKKHLVEKVLLSHKATLQETVDDTTPVIEKEETA